MSLCLCLSVCPSVHPSVRLSVYSIYQPYHPAAQDWLPTEAKQGWAWSVPGWETSGENSLLLEEVLVRPAGGAHPVVCVGPNAPV